MAKSVYKHPHLPRKQNLCAVCSLETRGPVVELHLTHGVSVWLCRYHASEEFQTMRSGRDFDLTLFKVWQANRCFTRNHRLALAAHRRRQLPRRRRSEADLPGSHNWKALRNEAEHRFADGESLRSVLRDLRSRHAHDTADAPSERTIRRWFHDGRWRRGVRTPLRRGFDRRDTRAASRAQRVPARVARLRTAAATAAPTPASAPSAAQPRTGSPAAGRAEPPRPDPRPSATARTLTAHGSGPPPTPR